MPVKVGDKGLAVFAHLALESDSGASDRFALQGLDEIMAEELALIPGMDEIVSLTNIYRNARQGNFEVVIIDAAPTGVGRVLPHLPVPRVGLGLLDPRADLQTEMGGT